MRSLRTKIFLRFTLLVGLTLIATGVCSVFVARHAIENRVTMELSSLVAEKAETLRLTFRSHRTSTELLARDLGLVELLGRGVPTNALRLRLLEARERVPGLRDILAVSGKGVILTATDSQREGSDISASAAFKEGSRAPTMSPLPLTEGVRIHTVASPVRNTSGVLVGVLVAEFDLSETYDMLAWNQGFAENGEFLLVDLQGTRPLCLRPHDVLGREKMTLSSTPSRGILGTLATQEFLPPAEAAARVCDLALGNAGILVGLDASGRKVFAAHHPIPDLGIGILAEIPQGEVLRPVGLLLALLIGTTCVLLFLVAFIALRLSRDVVQPILALRWSLEQLDTGHWTHVPTIVTGDELEVLDHEVARLALRLEEAYTSLEKRVEERTQELAEEHGKDEALLESIGEGVLAVDMSGTIITCNRAAEQMLKWRKEQILGKHFTACLALHHGAGEHFVPREHFVQRALNQKVTTRTSAQRTHYCERHDGTSFPISLTAMPFLMGMEMKGVVVTFRDVSEEKRIDTMKSEFISLASHQLRTPLTAIGWYVELLQKETAHALSSDQKDYINQIISSHQRMVNLVNDLLNVSRIELGRLKIEPERTDVLALIDNTVQELMPQIQERKLQFHPRLPKKLHASIDARLVQIVLENLLSNATKYTEPGGSIELALIASPEEMRFEVRDTGYGIPQDQQHRIFEKLFRADNVVKADTVGTGIGLYITKSCVEAWGGKLWFESEEGVGTTFSFTVPREMKKVDGASAWKR